MSEEWGPWIEHDGSGCPCKGQWVQVVCADGKTFEGIAYQMFEDVATGETCGPCANCVDMWDWDDCVKFFMWNSRVIRYRIRKPKGLQILQYILREVEDDGGVGYKEREREKEEAST